MADFLGIHTHLISDILLNLIIDRIPNLWIMNERAISRFQPSLVQGASEIVNL